MVSSDRHDWGTPQEFFNTLNAEFKFTLDVCATAKNAKCKKYYTPTDNGLAQPWRGRCFCNPPYGREYPKWVRKAHRESKKGTPVIVLLLPARTDTQVFHDYIWDAKKGCARQGVEVRFLKGRLTFHGAPAPALFPSMVVILRS